MNQFPESIDKLFELVYGYMTGTLIRDVHPELAFLITNEYENHTCEELYEEIGLARNALSAHFRLEDGEDPAEVLSIYQSYEKIHKILCEKAFHYGWMLCREYERKGETE